MYWNLGLSGTCRRYMGIIALVVLKNILRSFVALFSKWAVTSKQQALQQIGLKFGIRRVIEQHNYMRFL